jgi:hypothetical protein
MNNSFSIKQQFAARLQSFPKKQGKGFTAKQRSFSAVKHCGAKPKIK